MLTVRYLIAGFILVFVYKITTNLSALLRLYFYQKKYNAFASGQIASFNEYAPAVRKLFKSAGIKDSSVPFVQPAGYGFLSKGSASFFGNLATSNTHCVALMYKDLAEAKGIFKGRILESFSPMYWINCVVYLPRNILGYLGLGTDGIASKLLQLIYWIATPLLVAFRDNIYQYIAELLG